MKKTRVMLDGNGRYTVYNFSGEESFTLYTGVSAVYGEYILGTGGNPTSLEELEDAGDENAVTDIAAILADPTTPWEECTDEDYKYVALTLLNWGIE